MITILKYLFILQHFATMTSSEGFARVYVGGLNDTIKKEDLQTQFEKFGKLNKVWVAFNPPGFAFIEFFNMDEAEMACSNMNGTEIMGAKLRVEISRGRGRSGRGGRGRGERGGGRGRGGFGSRGGFRESSGGYDRGGSYYSGGGGNNSGRYGQSYGGRGYGMQDSYRDGGNDYYGGKNPRFRSRSPSARNNRY